MHQDNKVRPIIIKRVRKKVNKHHGGSWKIAYADFVTAMMAFFLLMWLLSMLNKYQLEGISEYFKQPIRTSMTTHTIGNEPNQTRAGFKSGLAQQPTKDQQEKQAAAKTLAELEKIRHELQQKLEQDPKLSQYKNQLNFVITSNGLKIQLKELENKPMFSEGKTDFQDYAKDIVSWLANELKTVPNHVVIIGHTDSKSYGDDNDYTNWELSADRANATRRILVKEGMPPEKILRIMGAADTNVLDQKDTENAINRRIEIIVLTDEAAERMKKDAT